MNIVRTKNSSALTSRLVRASPCPAQQMRETCNADLVPTTDASCGELIGGPETQQTAADPGETVLEKDRAYILTEDNTSHQPSLMTCHSTSVSVQTTATLVEPQSHERFSYTHIHVTDATNMDETQQRGSCEKSSWTEPQTRSPIRDLIHSHPEQDSSFSLTSGPKTSSSSVQNSVKNTQEKTSTSYLVASSDLGENKTRESCELDKTRESCELDKTRESLDKTVRPLPAKQDSADNGRLKLSVRLSRSFANLFQKTPTNSPALSTCTEKPGQGMKVSRWTRKVHGQNAGSRSWLPTKLAGSVSEWRRKVSKKKKKKNASTKQNKITTTDATTESAADSTSRDLIPVFVSPEDQIPIFVSPEDQIEIVEDAPGNLTQDQKNTLRDSWFVIKQDVAEVGVETFMGLFHTHPESMESFLAFKDKTVADIGQSAVLKAHALRVMQTVDKCVTRLEDFDKMAEVLCNLGQRHLGYRANNKLIPIIGKQFISAIEPKLAHRWSEGTRKAWEALFCVINYNMRRGMTQEKHRVKDEAAWRKTQ